MSYFDDEKYEKYLTTVEKDSLVQFDTQIEHIKNIFENLNFIKHIQKLICKSPSTNTPVETTDLIKIVQTNDNDAYAILNTKSTLNITMTTTIDRIQKQILSLNAKIDEKESKLDIRFNATDIFNNDEQNINIQNKLIYLIRYKYNLFLSILFVIGMIVTYHYLIPTLQIPISITNTIAPS
tara:strand:+ start:2067 stop:2609 length:543 start_codon:yes stop_codon:yes gene_type:complete